MTVSATHVQRDHEQNAILEFRALLGERTRFTLESLLAAVALEVGDRVVWSGSLLEGYGNSTSDIDLYVIGKSIEFRPGARMHLFGGHVMPSQTIGGKTRIDINYVDHEFLRAMSACLEGFAEFDPDRPILDPETLEIAHRLTFGIEIAGCDGSQAWRPSKAALIENIRARMTERANSFKQDSLGAAEAGDVETAIIGDRMRFHCLLDAYLAKSGLTNCRFDKWRLAKLRKLGASEYRETLLVVDGIRQTEPRCPADLLSYIRQACRKLEDTLI